MLCRKDVRDKGRSGSWFFTARSEGRGKEMVRRSQCGIESIWRVRPESGDLLDVDDVHDAMLMRRSREKGLSVRRCGRRRSVPTSTPISEPISFRHGIKPGAIGRL